MIRVVVDMVEVDGVVTVQRTSVPGGNVTQGEFAALHLLCVQFEGVDAELQRLGMQLLRFDGTPRTPRKKTTKRRIIKTTK